MKRVDFYICDGELETPFPQQREDPYEEINVIEIRVSLPEAKSFQMKQNPLSSYSPFRGINMVDLPKPKYDPLLDNAGASWLLREISEAEE